MRLAALLLVAFALTIPASSVPRSGSQSVRISRPAGAALFVPGEILVGLREDAASKAAVTSLALDNGLSELDSAGLERLGVARFRVAPGADVDAVVAKLAALPTVRFAEPNAIVYPADVPTDPLYAGVLDVPTDLQRWAFGGIGNNRVLNAEAAWDITKGDPSVVVAVLDSGVDLDNPEFKSVWTNPGEIPSNGVDDDHNGFVDDVHGYDFHNGRGDVNPDPGDGVDNDNNDRIDDSAPHGTIASSLISAAHDGVGMVGGAPDCSLMVVKIFGDDGGVPINQLAAAIEYAADNGADVLNLSLATQFQSEALLEGVRYALDRNVVVVAAAGNANSGAPQYPASYNLVVSVGGSGSGFSAAAVEGSTSLGRLDGRWPSSEYGLGAVKVVAPAVVYAASFATVGYNAEHPDVAVGDTFYGVFEGTSFAAPYVAALAGLVISRDKAVHGHRTLAPADVLALIERTTTDLPRDPDREHSGPSWDGYGRVNYLNALLAIPGVGDPSPSIERVAYGKKEFKVFGDGFSLDSRIEINGVTIEMVPTFSYAQRLLQITGTKKALGLKKRGRNTIVVVERDVRSPEFVY